LGGTARATDQQEWLRKVVDAAGATAIEPGLQIHANRLDEIEGGLAKRRTDAD